MSNSDKYTQDDAIVSDGNEPQLEGVLGGADVGGDKPEIVEDADEKVDADEFDGIKKDNIIDADGGLLSTVGKRGQDAPNYAEADAKADEQVAQVTDELNDGKSAVAQ